MRRRAGRWVLCLTAALTAGGCGESRSEVVPVRRLLHERPDSAFEVTGLFGKAEVQAWLSDGDASAWQVADGARAASDGGLLLGSGPAGRSTVWRPVAAAAERIDGVVIRSPDRPPGRVQLFWAPPGEPFQAELSAEVEAATATASGFETFIPLWSHPAWTGEIAKIRLTATVPQQRRALTVTEVAAVRLLPDSEAVARQLGRPLLLELGHELRPALLALPGRPVTWETEAAAGDVLTFGFGAPLPGGGATVRVRRGDGRGSVLLERVIEPGRWHDGRIELDQAPEPVRLAFECETAGGGPVFWSGPELSGQAPSNAGPNLLLISLDTLRPDHLSLYGYERETTPQLDRWAEGATVFEQAVTTAPWTLPAHLSMLTGLDAFQHGVNHRTRVPEGLDLLAEGLGKAGYLTAAITGGGYLDPAFGLTQGFDSYRYYPRRAAEEELEESLHAALAWLERGPRRPWFLFFHTYEPHHPYHARQPYLDRWSEERSAVPDPSDLAYVSSGLDEEHGFQLSKHWRLRLEGGDRELSPDELRGLVDLYDSGVAYTDAAVGRLIEAAERGGGTVTVATSDHGEALGEHGLAGHAYLHDFNALVPLAVKRPGRRGPARVATQVRITDIAPTLLELAGLEPPVGVDGRSLVSLLDGAEEADREASIYASFANRGLALRLGRGAKFLFNNTVWEPLWGRRALYDLRSDAEETRDLLEEGVAVHPLDARARALSDRVQGAVRIAFANLGTHDLRGALHGPALHVSRVRSPDLPPGAASWAGGRRKLLLTLRAGESFDLLLENPPGSLLRIEMEPDLRASLDLDSLDGGLEWRRTDRRWVVAPGASETPADAVITVAWSGDPGDPGDPGAEDAELREQLEALGYIQ